MVYALRGQRIFEATLRKSEVGRVEIHATETDPDTELVWHKVSVEGWVAPGSLLSSPDALWTYSAEMYNASCGTCHSTPDPGHSLANQWIGSLKAMKRFITLNKEEYRLLQKYLQLNARDTGGAAHHADPRFHITPEVTYRWLAQFFLHPLTGADLEEYQTVNGRGVPGRVQTPPCPG